MVIGTDAARPCVLGDHSFRIPSAQDMATQGVLINAAGFQIRESAQIQSPAIGTASSATVSSANHAIGSTSIALASTGSGTIVAGDVISLANDPNYYVVVTGNTDVSNGGTIVIAAPASACYRHRVPGNHHPRESQSFNGVCAVCNRPGNPYARVA